MPTYEYACSKCDHRWEEVQRITAAPLEVCPKCKKKGAHRLISAGNFILKGSGWYSDLYSSPKPKAETAAKEGGSKDSTDSAKANGATESKPEKKAEASTTKESTIKAEKKPAKTGTTGSKGD
jgi:putative FmdB family regulatory protein